MNDRTAAIRSWLFVPGDDERKLAKAADSGADALIIDLEDSVSASRKSQARVLAASFVKRLRQSTARPALYVRVNPLASFLHMDDLDAVMPAAPDGIVLPKGEGGIAIQQLSVRLAVREAEHGLDDGVTRIMAIATETARSLFLMGSFEGASQRLAGLAWGAEDLAADLGAETNRAEDGHYADPYRLARTLTLVGASAADVAPIDTVFTNFRDADGLRAEANAARRDGFVGKMAIHPAQVSVINEVFTPTEAALAHARAIIEAFAADPEAGVIGINGQMIDRPHLRQAERIIARANRRER